MRTLATTCISAYVCVCAIARKHTSLTCLLASIINIYGLDNFCCYCAAAAAAAIESGTQRHICDAYVRHKRSSVSDNFVHVVQSISSAVKVETMSRQCKNHLLLRVLLGKQQHCKALVHRLTTNRSYRV